METLYLVLVLMGCVAASSFVSRLPRVSLPLPFVQIAIGAVLSLVVERQVTIDPEVFLILFIAPLLYLDGWRIQKEGLLRDKWTIGALALGLVVFTVTVAGCFIHWLLPTMPLAVAFALSSVLSPTDAVAVSAITARMAMPPRLMRILEGESLLNDASGLVCLRFAVAAALTGTFSLGSAVGLFAWLAIGGVAIGAGVAWVANAAKDWMSRRFGEEPGSQIIISLLIPFGAYLLASRLQASGVLAAVAAGIAMNYEEQSGRALAVTRIRRAAIWDAVQFAGNGAIFVLLGHQLSGIVIGAVRLVDMTGHRSPVWLLGYVLAITAVLAGLRFVWAGVTLGFMRRGAEARRSVGIPAARLAAAASVAGVRGAVTLSAVMALPLVLSDGSPFPGRDLVIFLAAGVIVASLIVANFALPWLIHGIAMPSLDPRRGDEGAARLAAAEAATTAIEQWLDTAGRRCPGSELREAAAARVLAPYRERLDHREASGDAAERLSRIDEIERELALVGLAAERAAVYGLVHDGRLDDRVSRRLVRRIDLAEVRYRQP